MVGPWFLEPGNLRVRIRLPQLRFVQPVGVSHLSVGTCAGGGFKGGGLKICYCKLCLCYNSVVCHVVSSNV